MKQLIPLSADSALFERAAHGPLTCAEVQTLLAAKAEDGLSTPLPAQVADVLLAHGRITDPRRPDGAKDCTWIPERDWTYRIPFDRPDSAPGTRCYLHCLGLDTLADLYLNGTLLGSARDMYLPLRLDVSDQLLPSNVLLVHFHSPTHWVASQTMDPAWQGLVHPNRLLRKPHEDFNSFNGAFPCFTPVGIFAAVQLELVPHLELTDTHFSCKLSPTHDWAELSVTSTWASTTTPPTPAHLRLRLLGPNGQCVFETDTACPSGSSSLTTKFRLEAPDLWWPRGYGAQPLYQLIAELHSGDQLYDRLVRVIGLRELTMLSDFALRVNGVPVKLWGANLAPLEQFTHVWPGERIPRLLDLVENAGMVTLRLWGPGAPYGDNLYDECDRRGILLWSEFPHTWGMYPDTPEYYALCQAEAEHHVRKLRHHPSIFMWCGGNEVHMGSELTHPGRPLLSWELYHQIYPEVCSRLDPTRYYHIDSPLGGDFANDPDQGDSHGYTHFWFVRGCDYPVILTENARWSPPELKTLRRYIPEPEKLWPTGFVSRIRHRRAPASGPGSPSTGLNNNGRLDQRDFHDGGLIPPAWQLLGKDGNITNGRAGPLGDFYDTGDTPEGLIYRLGSAHSLFIRREVERLRRGRPAHQAGQPRRTQGHYWWRLNGTWPLIDSEVIDYLLEPKMAYYALARAHAPVLLSFEFGDRIHLWLTNDTPKDLQGTVRIDLLPQTSQSPVQSLLRRFTALAGRSDPVLNLDSFGMFRRELVLRATFFDDHGQELAHCLDFADAERNLIFPDPQLSLRAEGADAFVVKTDLFARSIELQGQSPSGDDFGWDFSDNHFDLAPGEEKLIRLRGQHRHGTLTARARWGSASSRLLL